MIDPLSRDHNLLRVFKTMRKRRSHEALLPCEVRPDPKRRRKQVNIRIKQSLSIAPSVSRLGTMVKSMNQGFRRNFFVAVTRGVNISWNTSFPNIGDHRTVIHRPHKAYLFFRSPAIPYFNPVRKEGSGQEVGPFFQDSTFQLLSWVEEVPTSLGCVQVDRSFVWPMPAACIKL